jgi:S-disulfanyl-L-cysteine oxidoreductase SoxD
VAKEAKMAKDGTLPACWPRWSRAAGLPLLIALVGWLTAVALSQEGADAPARVASEGVYDEEQAEAGAALYAARCASCHADDLSGFIGPPLSPFGSWWLDGPVARMFEYASRNMPQDDPGGLEAEEYAALIAFILESNGYPAGEEPLPADAEALEVIVLDALPEE